MPPPTPTQIEMGKRLKESAQAAGFNSRTIGERLGVEDGTVRGWWRGRGQPDPDKLRAYALVVDRSADWLLNIEKPLAGLGYIQEVAGDEPPPRWGELDGEQRRVVGEVVRLLARRR